MAFEGQQQRVLHIIQAAVSASQAMIRSFTGVNFEFGLGGRWYILQKEDILRLGTGKHEPVAQSSEGRGFHKELSFRLQGMDFLLNNSSKILN